MPIGTIHNRIYKGIIIGITIRGQIGKDKIFRFRRGNGYYNSLRGTQYQDQFDYFVPPSINNVESDPYRAQLTAAVVKWKFGLTETEKKEYNKRATRSLRMSGYNLFMREAMKGLISMYVNRGDPAAYDYVKTDLTLDGAWHTLDLSSLVPKGAAAVFLVGHLEGAAIDWGIKFKKNGQTNDVNHGGMETIRANIERHRSSIVSLDSDRKIEYRADNQAWTTLNLAVRGWWT